MLKPPNTPMYEYIHDTIQDIYPISAAIEYVSEETLPDAFAVYYLVSGNPEGHFTNTSRRENERYSVQIFDRDKRNLEPASAQIKAAMLAAGFLYITTSPDIAHTDSAHWSRTLDFRYYEEVTQ